MTVRRVATYQPLSKAERRHKCDLPDPSTMQWKWAVLQCEDCGQYWWAKKKKLTTWYNRLYCVGTPEAFKWVKTTWDAEEGTRRSPHYSGGFSPT